LSELDPAVVEQLLRFDVSYRVVAVAPEYGDVSGLWERYGFGPEMIANTLVIAGRTEPITFAACVVLATSRLDINKKAAALLGLKRGRATFATPEQTTKVTGMMVGGVTVFGLPSSLLVYIDDDVMAGEEILMGGGNLSSKLLIAPSALRRLHNVEVVSGLGVPRTLATRPPST
jgi:prolyl-tRNA editing enzyme YbaK/EbsC (Cys-tRNA(Pro) deacylase)